MKNQNNQPSDHPPQPATAPVPINAPGVKSTTAPTIVSSGQVSPGTGAHPKLITGVQAATSVTQQQVVSPADVVKEEKSH